MPIGSPSNQTNTILALAANPADTMRLRLDKEVREINHGLQRAREGFVLQQHWAVRPADIRRAMLDYRPVILHFCGHGEGEAGLVFENEQGQSVLVDATPLRQMVDDGAKRCALSTLRRIRGTR